MKKIFDKKLLLILLIAFLLRQVPLSQSLWLDEATSGLVVRNLNFSEIITKFLPSDFHPPLYYIFLKIWSLLFGFNEISLRSFSLIAGVLTVYVVYLLSKELQIKNKYLPTFLLATSALHIYYSAEARMYSLATLFVSVVFLLLLKLLNDNKNIWAWIFLGTFQLLSFGTHYLTILIIPVVVFYGIIKKISINFWRRYLISLTPSAIALFIWLPILIKQLGGGIGVSKSSPLWAEVLGKTSIKEIALLFIKFSIGRISFDNKLVYGLFVSLIFLPLMYVFIKNLKKIKESIMFYWFFVPIFLGSLVGLFIPVFSYFRFLFVLPAFYLLISISILEVKKYKLLIYIFLIINLLSSFYYLFNPKFYKEDWRSLVGFIEGSRMQNSQVLFVANSQMEAYKYYNSDAKIDGPEALDSKSEEIWLVRYVKELFDPNDSLKTKVESLGFNEEGNYDFNGIPVLRYERKNANSN